MGLGFGEILVILIIVLLVFGAKRLPEVSRALGSSVNEFKKGLEDVQEKTLQKPDISVEPDLIVEPEEKASPENKTELEEK